MAVMELILDERWAMFRNCRCHEFANDAAKVCGHQHRFQSVDLARVKLKVYEAEKVYEIVHRCLKMAYR